MAKRDDAKKPGDAPLGSPENPVRTMPVTGPVDPNAPDDGGLGSLTPEQRAGLAPLDPQLDQEQALDRFNRPNLQTEHEAANALDAMSSGPSPGITSDTPLTGKQQGQGATDMSGRPPVDLSDDDKEVFSKIREALTKAKTDDNKTRDKPEEQRGFRTPMEMGIPGGVVQRIIAVTDPDEKHVERAVMPAGHFFPETGTRYRLAK